MTEQDIVSSFENCLTEAGLVLKQALVADGTMQRCGTADKPNSKNGSYVAYMDAPATLWWQNWQTSESGTWCAKNDQEQSPKEREAFKKHMQAVKLVRQQEEAAQHEEAATLATNLWTAAAPADDSHTYLQRKEVPCLGLRLAKDGRLIVPVLDGVGLDGKLQSLQFIDSAGGKRFLPGGKMAGGFFFIPAKDGGKAGPLLIAEGYATAASLHCATGYAVLVAFNCGNLLAVATMAREQYREREIILAADNDVNTAGNPGLTEGTEAAQAVWGKLALCPAHEGGPTDFNDLHLWRGLDAVRMEVEAAAIPERALNITADKLPDGFVLNCTGKKAGLWFLEMKEDHEPIEIWIGPPLHVLGATRDEMGNAWGLLLKWDDPDGREHTWAMPKALLVGKDISAWLGRLADEGWSGAPGMGARNKLALYLSAYRTERRALCVPCTGWHKCVFVLPDEVIENQVGQVGQVGQAYSHNGLPLSHFENASGTSGTEKIVLQVHTPHNPFRIAGTLEGWQNTIGKWAQGNSRLMLALCASLAASLLEVAGQESGGFNWTGASSTGKTTALVAAGSCWGKGSSAGGYVQNWRATSNGLEGLAALHSDTALCLDEIGQAPGRTITEASYMLANGMGKARAMADGSAKAAKSWRCMVLSTGEKGLAEKIAEENGKVQAGQAVRLIDIPADAGAGFGLFEELHGHDSARAFADAIKQAATSHYGHAARAFIAKVQQDRPNLQESLHIALDNAGTLFCPVGASGQVERVARRFALCAAAGEMATEWGLFPWEEGDAMQALKACFTAWLALRGGAGLAEDTAILAQITLFIEQHGASRFQDVDRPDALCVNRVGFRKSTQLGTEFYILPESFKAEVCKGVNHKRAISVLMGQGILLPGDGNHASRRPPCDLPGYGRKRCYVLLYGGDSDGLA